VEYGIGGQELIVAILSLNLARKIFLVRKSAGRQVNQKKVNLSVMYQRKGIRCKKKRIYSTIKLDNYGLLEKEFIDLMASWL